jgi:hypothetical protein
MDKKATLDVPNAPQNKGINVAHTVSHDTMGGNADSCVRFVGCGTDVVVLMETASGGEAPLAI